MATEGVIRMNVGEGEKSYLQNSSLQRKVILQVKTFLEENMTLHMTSNKNMKSCRKIADLGCSSGSNTLVSISNITNIINKISLKLNDVKTPHIFQIYLNDLFENDFNTLFKLLPDFYQDEKEEKVGEYFISATPGSFYGRLFPNNYIDFFHSSYTLHWLSQVPKDLAKKAEQPYKGYAYILKTNPLLVYEAYLKQFERDFTYFLKLRFEELAPDGMMMLTLLGEETRKETNSFQDITYTILIKMVEEGLVEKEKLKLLDNPIYRPTVEEVRQVIEEEGSFTLQTLKTFKIGWDANLQEDIVDYVVDSKMRGEYIAKHFRAVSEPLWIMILGENIMNELYSRFAKEIAQLLEIETLDFTNIVLFMTKDP